MTKRLMLFIQSDGWSGMRPCDVEYEILPKGNFLITSIKDAASYKDKWHNIPRAEKANDMQKLLGDDTLTKALGLYQPPQSTEIKRKPLTRKKI